MVAKVQILQAEAIAGVCSSMSRIVRHQLVMGHVVGDIDGAREAEGVGAAMALDDDAVKAEEHAAIGLARIHLVAKGVERLPGK